MALTKITSRILDSSGVTILGTIATGVWQGTAINQTYLVGQSGTNTGDETLARINALDVTELGTISSGVWNGTAINQTYLVGQSGTNTGDQTTISGNAGTVTNGVYTTGNQTIAGVKTFSSAATFQLSALTNPSGVDSNTVLTIKNNGWSGITMLSSAAAGSFLTFGDADAGFRGRIQYIQGSTDAMVFETAASEKMRITSGGNVGIGNPSIPSDHKLQIHNALAYSRFALSNSTSGSASGDGLKFQLENLNAIIKNQENGYLTFGTNGRETDFTISSGGLATFSNKIIALNWIQGINSTNVLYSATTAGTVLQTPGATANNNNSKIFFRNSGGLVKQTFDTQSGAATFSGNVTASQGSLTHASTPLILNNTGSTYTQVDFQNNGTQKAAIWWNNSTNTLNLYNSGNAGVAALTITSGGVLQAKYGISFPNQSGGNTRTVASSTLDAYEEGTWTPTFRGAVTAGSYTLNNFGSTYTRIGRVVTISFNFSITVIGSDGSAYAQIRGLPYTKPSGRAYVGSLRTTTAMGGQWVTIAFATSNATNILYLSANGTGGGDVQISSFGVGSALLGSITYEI